MHLIHPVYLPYNNKHLRRIHRRPILPFSCLLYLQEHTNIGSSFRRNLNYNNIDNADRNKVCICLVKA